MGAKAYFSFWLWRRVKCQYFTGTIFHALPVFFHHLHSCWGQRTKPVHFSQEKHPVIPTKLLTWMVDRPCAYFASSDFPPGPFPPFKLSNTLADIWAFNLKHSSKIESYGRIETHFKFLMDSRFSWWINIKVEGVWFLFYQENIRTEQSKYFNCLKILCMCNLLRSLW